MVRTSLDTGADDEAEEVDQKEEKWQEAAVAKYSGKLGLPEEDLIFKEAQALFDEYASESAQTQVNLNSNNLRKIQAVITSGYAVRTSFDACRTEIENLMERDSFGRFKKSTFFQTFLSDIEIYQRVFGSDTELKTA